MNKYQYDLCVIGGGSGGVRAARIAAQKGLKVLLVEKQALGGTCVNVGCVPKKLFVYASQYASEIHDAKGFGWNIEKSGFHWKTLVKNKNKEILRLNSIYKSLLENSGVEIKNGLGKIVSPNTISVGDEEFSTATILVASGSRPFIPDFPGNEHVLNSNDMFYLKELPNKMVIVGGGYISLEFASIMNGLGVEVEVVIRGSHILNTFDQEVRDFLYKQMEDKGIKFITNSEITHIEKKSTNLLLTIDEQHQNKKNLSCDLVLFATGRVPLTSDMGLESVGVKLGKKGEIVVDNYYQTSVPSIYALGDVIGKIALTPVAIAEAMCFVANLIEKKKKSTLNYTLIPTAVFSQPNVGTVGLSEEEALKIHKKISVFTTDFRALKNNLSGSAERTFMKLIVETKSDKVVGVHMVGHEAGEIIQSIAVALKAGATKSDFDQTVGVHPTAAEEFVTLREVKRTYP